VLQLVACAADLAVAAAATISLKHHQATHPRLGAIDHVVCQYLPSEGDGGEVAAVAAAHGIAAKVSERLPTLPVVLYGRACSRNRRLQDIRRACGALQGLLLGLGAQCVYFQQHTCYYAIPLQ
jgi:glutamate formiminotransferase